jgi:hypothetical protein
MTPRFILSTLKCNNMTLRALKLHLHSIKFQKSFYSSNFFNFTCTMMSRFAKFQVFFSSTILIPASKFVFQIFKAIFLWTMPVVCYYGGMSRCWPESMVVVHSGLLYASWCRGLQTRAVTNVVRSTVCRHNFLFLERNGWVCVVQQDCTVSIHLKLLKLENLPSFENWHLFFSLYLLLFVQTNLKLENIIFFHVKFYRHETAWLFKKNYFWLISQTFQKSEWAIYFMMISSRIICR